jgi:hypothetical protein
VIVIDLRPEPVNTYDSMRIGGEPSSNEIDESDLQNTKHPGHRILTSPGIVIDSRPE